MLAFRIRMQPPPFTASAKKLMYCLDVDDEGRAMFSAASLANTSKENSQQWLSVEPNFIWRTPLWIMVRWRLRYPDHQSYLRGDLARAWQGIFLFKKIRHELVSFAWFHQPSWHALQRWVTWRVRQHQQASSPTDPAVQVSPHG